MTELFGYRSEADEPRWLRDRENSVIAVDEKILAARVRKGLSRDDRVLAEGRAVFIDSMWTSDAYVLVTTGYLIVGAANVSKPWKRSPPQLMRIPLSTICGVAGDDEGIAVLVTVRGFALQFTPDPSNPNDESEFVLRLGPYGHALRSAILGLSTDAP